MKRISFFLVFSCLINLNEAVFAATQKTVVVGPDDTVYGIAYNNGIPTRTLISANNLKAPYTLKDGQTLIIPSSNEHIVGDGETLQSIAENYGVNVDILSQENGLQSPFVSPGDHLNIPSHDTESFAEAFKTPVEDISTSSLAPLPLVKTAPLPTKSAEHLPANTQPAPEILDDLAAELAQEKEAAKPKASSSSAKSSKKSPVMGNLAAKTVGGAAATATGVGATALPDDTEKKEEKPKKPVQKEEKKAEKKEVKEDVVEEKKELSFIWPVKGEVIGKFGGKNKNEGIDIKVSEGTPVKAAADGTVMYAGNELKDFGNLLLIKHKEGWVTAYAHNSAVLVKKGDRVKQGDKIAKSGVKGDSDVAQLHFEIRKVKQPIDPLPKLES